MKLSLFRLNVISYSISYMSLYQHTAMGGGASAGSELREGAIVGLCWTSSRVDGWNVCPTGAGEGVATLYYPWYSKQWDVPTPK